MILKGDDLAGEAEVEVEVEVQATLSPSPFINLENSQHTLDFGGPPYVDVATENDHWLKLLLILNPKHNSITT